MPKEPTDARSRFAQRLRAIRIPRGFKTARSFARALGIDENRYTRYERAEVEPDLQLLLRMCELLRATPNDLLCDTIGSPPIDSRMADGFAEAPAAGFESSAPSKAPPAASPTTARSSPRPPRRRHTPRDRSAGWRGTRTDRRWRARTGARSAATSLWPITRPDWPRGGWP